MHLGATIERYVVEGILGEGGMATVYAVRHVDLGTRHALKLLKIRSRSLIARLLQEGRAQASLRHPNIVAVTDVVRWNDDVGIVMDRIDGVSLDVYLHHRSLSPAQVEAVAADLFAGVDAAHRGGVIHRDLKPSNIMLACEGERVVAKVTDFGLAKALRDDLAVGRATRSGVMMGTPQYMAPEQHYDAKHVDARADVFSVGATLYEVITRQLAFPALAPPDVLQQILGERATPIADRAPDAPARWVRAVERALKPDRADRPTDVAALAALWAPCPTADAWAPEDVAAIRDLAASAVRETPAPPTPPPAPGPTLLPPRTDRTLAITVGLGSAALGVGGMVVGALALLAAIGVGTWALTREPAAAAPAAAAPEPAAPAAAAPEPTEPAATEPAATAPAPPPTPPPAPAAPAATPARPPPAPDAPAPDAPAPDAPAPVPRAPSVVLPGSLDGYLIAPDGTRHDLASAPPGQYDLFVFFDLQLAEKASRVTVVDGESRVLRCDRGQRTCG